MIGVFGFGAVLGWYLYFDNRYRKEVSFADFKGVLSVIGGGAALKFLNVPQDRLLPVFEWYGAGVAAGFFGYFLVLCVLIACSGGTFGVGYLIDGRSRVLAAGEMKEGTPPVRSLMEEGGK